MKVETLSSGASHGLTSLATLKLDAVNRRRLAEAAETNRGPAPWRSRKEVETRQLLALAQIAPRLQVLELDLSESLRTAVVLHAPIPCLPSPGGPLRVEHRSLLGITYRQQGLTTPLPGYAFVEVLHPRHVWHPNVALGRGQPVCLGVSLPVGIPVTELVLLTYAALTLQSVMLDEKDAAGLMNLEAARWWQKHRDRIPLSKAPFLSAEDLDVI